MQSDRNSTLNVRTPRGSSIIRLLAGAILTTASYTASVSAAQFQPLTEVAKAAESFLLDSGGRQFGDSLSVEIQAPDPRLRLALCEQPLTVFSAPGSRAFGNTSVGVRCEGLVPWTVYLRARVRVWQEVLVSRGALSRGDALVADDVMLQKMDVSQITGRFLHHSNQAVDLELRRSVAPGVVLTQNMLRRIQVIDRGDRVTLLARVGNLSVRVAGRALAAGAKGDQIAVENIASGRRVQGVVMADGLVRTDHNAMVAKVLVPLADDPKGMLVSADNQGVF